MTEHDEVLLRATGLSKKFSAGRTGLLGRHQYLHAVDDVSLEVRQGETLALVGESGCGKSTLARTLLKLHPASGGRIEFGGQDITDLSTRQMRPLRREMQMIFQDPYGSLNPRRRVGSIIGEAFAVHGTASGDERRRKVQELMEVVGLNPEHFNRFPADFSGGQRQRIGVARALALRPKLMVCDEPVSALDVSIQAQILNLLMDLQHEFDLTYIFISHDLSVVRHISDRVAVMYLGRIVETAPSEDLFRGSAHPYTRALLSASPELSPGDAPREIIVLAGDLPSPAMPPPGCHFHPRCPKAQHECTHIAPQLEVLGGDRSPDHAAECLFPLAPDDSLAVFRPSIEDTLVGHDVVDVLAEETP